MKSQRTVSEVNYNQKSFRKINNFAKFLLGTTDVCVLLIKILLKLQLMHFMSLSRKSTSGFGFSDGTRLGLSKFICIPNFDEISQFTAKLLQLPVSEN